MNNESFTRDLILEQLVELDEGELITYSELSALTGVDVQFKNRNLLDDALQDALDNYGIVFENKRNIGYEKLSAPDVIRRHKELDKHRRTSIRGRKKLSTATDERLEHDPVLRNRRDAMFWMHAAVGCMATDKAVVYIEGKIGTIEDMKNIQKVIEAVRGALE